MINFEILKNKTILIVEDERVIRENMTSLLQNFFKNVYSAINGLDGIDKYEKFLPDIILTDLKMPHMDGYEMLKKIKKDNDDIFTVIISAHSDTDLLLKAIHEDIDSYLIKPLQENDLFETFEKYINKIQMIGGVCYEINESMQLDFNKNIIINNKQEFHLNHKEILLLKVLTKNPNQVITYEEIETKVWGSSVMTLSAIRSLVRDLRKKLDSKYIKNISGIGYRFNL